MGIKESQTSKPNLFLNVSSRQHLSKYINAKLAAIYRKWEKRAGKTWQERTTKVTEDWKGSCQNGTAQADNKIALNNLTAI